MDTSEHSTTDATSGNANQVDNTGLSDDAIFKRPLVPPLPQDCVEELSLHTLPTELFLHICSFLRAKFVIRTLSQVCRLFRDLIMDDTFWKVRMKKRWPKPYPAIPVSDQEFDWKLACICREEEWHRWTEHEKTTTYFHLTNGCFASIDAVHLMQDGTLLATGSRDRNLSFLDLKSIDPHDPDSIEHCSLTVKMGAHKGWIWSFSSLDNLLISGSWDTFIKFWDISAPAGPTEIRAAKCKSAVLCCHLEQDILFAGAFDKKVYHIDPRVNQVLQTYSYHSNPVLCLTADHKYLVTGSEDNTIVVFDRPSGKVFKTIQVESFPMSLWMGQDQLWVGDRGGRLSLFDTIDGDFNIVQTYDVGHKSKMSGVICTQGSILTCSCDKQDNAIRILEPTLNPGLMAKLVQPGGPPVAQIDYQNEVLVSANSDVSVGLWIPKPEL